MECSTFEAVDKTITEYDAKTKILNSVQRVYDCSIERVAEASDIANVRVDAQSAEQRHINSGVEAVTQHYGAA